MAKSKRASATRKEDRPDWRKARGMHPDFPLFPHPAGYWAKKVLGKLYYFGKVADDPKGQAALTEWDRVKEARLAGREPRPAVDGTTVAELCDRFLQACDAKLASGDIVQKSYVDYKRVAERIVSKFGKGRVVVDLTSADFEALRASIARNYGPVALGNEIQRCRVVFNYGLESGLLDKLPQYGPLFKRTSKKALRKARAEKGAKMFAPEDLRRLIAAADVQLQAMILLAVNCGFGNTDCGTLPMSALDLDGGWVDFARQKTGVARRCWLWPETVLALRAAIGKRKAPKDSTAKRLVFITKYGASWSKATFDDPITKAFRKLLDKLKLHQPGLGFYALRHVFRTIAAGARDLEATRSIMGHSSGHVEEAYIEALPADERLAAVAEHVRTWLYAEPTKDGGATKGSGAVATRAKSKGAANRSRANIVAEGAPVLRVVG